MAHRLEIETPSGRAVLDVPADHLILSGQDWVLPGSADYITVRAAPVAYTYKPWRLTSLAELEATQTVKAKVLNARVVSAVEHVLPVDLVADPTDGQCICGVTCLGPNLRYVQVKAITT